MENVRCGAAPHLEVLPDNRVSIEAKLGQEWC